VAQTGHVIDGRPNWCARRHDSTDGSV